MEYLESEQRWRRSAFRCVIGAAAVFLAAVGSCAQTAQSDAAKERAATWEADEYPGLAPEIVRLVGRLQNEIQFPAARKESRLLPLLPESTVSYVAVPNYGEAAKQALKIFREELQTSEALRNWWQHGKLSADGPKIELAVERLAQLDEYLGEETVISGAMEGRDVNLLLVAAVKKPGLEAFLRQTIAELSGKSKPEVRVLNPAELAAKREKGDGREMLVLVRPDYVAVAADIGSLRTFSTRLDRANKEFADTAFGQRVKQEYGNGVTIIAGADLQTILKRLPANERREKAGLQHSGFADAKFLVWGHTEVNGQEVSQGELSFNGPRQGAAAWLAKPQIPTSLSFSSPQAVMAATAVLTRPAQIFEEVKQLYSGAGADGDPFTMLAHFEKALNLSVKDDLLNCLQGELTLELDGLSRGKPAWLAIFKVNDGEHLRQTLDKLLAATQLGAEHFDDGRTTYTTVKIPSQKAPMEIGYAFVDGHWVIGSSREAVAEAVHRHKTGESLGESKELAATLPPGHTLNASGMFYQNAAALAAMRMGLMGSRTSTEPLAKLVEQSAPLAMYVYGDESAIREASRSTALDAGVILVVAAVAIPNLMRSRMAANEAVAVGSVRTVVVAQVTYSATYPKRNYAPNLAALGPVLRDKPPTPERADLLPESLVNSECTPDGWCSKAGYRIRVDSVCKLRRCSDYVVLATPLNSKSGTRSFCAVSDGLVRFTAGPALAAPVSEAECQKWEVIR